MAAEGQSDKMASDTEVWMEHWHVTELLHVEQMAPTDIHQRLLNFYGDPTVYASVVRCGWCASAVATATMDHIHWCKFL